MPVGLRATEKLAFLLFFYQVTEPCHQTDFILFILRVFVNRSLAMEKIKYFGFDMDYTLAGK